MKIFIFSNPLYVSALIKALPEGIELVGLNLAINEPTNIDRLRNAIAQIFYDLGWRKPKIHIHHQPKSVINYKKRIFTLSDVKKQTFLNTLKFLSPDVFLCFGYPRLIPNSILNLATKGGINIHPGALPERSGGTPLRWSIFLGDHTLSLSAHAMTDKFDAGMVLFSTSFSIEPDDDYIQAEKKALAQLPRLIPTLFEKMRQENVRYVQPSEIQPRIQPSFKGALQRVNWTVHTTQNIQRICMALRPRSGALTSLNGEEVCFWKVAPQSDVRTDERSGTVIRFSAHGNPVVKTLDGCFEISEILFGHALRPGRFLCKRVNLKLGDCFE